MSNQIEYPYLPEGRDIKYVDINNKFMKAAFYAAKEGSTDLNYPTGAVVVKDGKIIGKGANQGLIKNKWFVNKHKDGKCLRKLFNVPSGQSYWVCPGCVPNHRHAEGNATRDAQKKEEGIRDFDVYLWGHWWACEVCWKTMIDAGIRDLYVLQDSEILLNKRGSKENRVGDFEFFEKMMKN